MVWELLYYTAEEANVYRELINYYRGQCIAQRVSDIISSRWFNAWHEGSDEMVGRRIGLKGVKQMGEGLITVKT